MCVNKPQGGVSLIRARHSKFIQLVQVAVESARLHAPSLAPYVLYVHGPDQPLDGETDDLLKQATGHSNSNFPTQNHAIGASARPWSFKSFLA